MKKQITLVAMVLLIIAGIGAGCKKETGAERPLKTKIQGKWQLAKVETTIEGTPMTSYTGVAADFFEFRNDENDQVEVNIGTERTLGTYAVLVTPEINLLLSGKLLNAAVNTITDNKFEFTATVNGSSPKETRKYFLTR
jgi:hypothetical protein